MRTVVELYRAEAREGLALLDRQLADPQELNAYVDYWSSCIAGARPRSASARCWPPAPMIPAEIAEEVRGHFEDLSGWLAVTLEKGVSMGQLQVAGLGGR